MDTLPLVIGGGLLATAVVLYILLPIVRGLEAPLHRMEEEETEDQHRRRVALSALRDVEYDYATGKLDEEDYRDLKEELSVEALRILEGARDRQAAREEAPDIDAGDGAEADEIEAEIARIRRGLQEGRTCRSCAETNPPGSSFCARCGRELQAAEKGEQVPADEG